MDNPAQPKANLYTLHKFSFGKKWLIISIVALILLVLVGALIYQKSNLFHRPTSLNKTNGIPSEVLGQVESASINAIKVVPVPGDKTNTKSQTIPLGIKTEIYSYRLLGADSFSTVAIAYSDLKPGDLIKKVVYNPDGSVSKVYVQKLHQDTTTNIQGTITKVEKNNATIQTTDGKTSTIPLAANFTVSRYSNSSPRPKVSTSTADINFTQPGSILLDFKDNNTQVISITYFPYATPVPVPPTTTKPS